MNRLESCGISNYKCHSFLFNFLWIASATHASNRPEKEKLLHLGCRGSLADLRPVLQRFAHRRYFRDRFFFVRRRILPNRCEIFVSRIVGKIQELHDKMTKHTDCQHPKLRPPHSWAKLLLFVQKPLCLGATTFGVRGFVLEPPCLSGDGGLSAIAAALPEGLRNLRRGRRGLCTMFGSDEELTQYIDHDSTEHVVFVRVALPCIIQCNYAVL